jgi:replicative DNA helicase
MAVLKTFDRTPPQSVEAERAVLGAMLLNPDAIQTAIEVLGELPDPFFVEQHQHLYRAVINLYREGSPVDMVTLTTHMLEERTLDKCGGAAYIADVTDAVPTSSNCEYYAGIVREMWRRRSLITACTQAAGDLYRPDSETDDVLAGLESATFLAAQNKGQSKPVVASELIPATNATLNSILDGGQLPGIRTGIKSLDNILRPLSPGDYVIVAARPSVGKSTFASNIVRGFMAQEVATLFLSLEVTKEMVVQKILGIVGNVDMRMVESGRALKSPTQKALAKAAAEVSKWPLYIDDNPEVTPLQLRSRIRQMVKDHGVGAVVIDYLGLITPPQAESRNIAVSEISRAVKLSAREAQVPIIALHQLNRGGDGTRPRLSNLRDSGSLEQDCDICILLSRIEDEPTEFGQPEVILADIAKQRLSAVGEVRLLFNKPLQQFRDMSHESETAAPEPFDSIDPIEDYYEEDDTEF